MSDPQRRSMPDGSGAPSSGDSPIDSAVTEGDFLNNDTLPEIQATMLEDVLSEDTPNTSVITPPAPVTEETILPPGKRIQVKIEVRGVGQISASISTHLENGSVWTERPLPYGVGSAVTISIIAPSSGGHIPTPCTIREQIKDGSGRTIGTRASFDVLDAHIGAALATAIAGAESNMFAEISSPQLKTATGASSPTEQSTEGAAAEQEDDTLDETLRVLQSTGRHDEALRVLRAAVDGDAMNVELHIKVAHAALAANNLKLAQWHAEFVGKIRPGHAEPPKIFEAILEKRNKVFERKREERTIRETTYQRGGSSQGRQRVMGVISGVIITFLIGYNAWLYAPRKGKVSPLQPAITADLIPTTEVKLYKKRLYLTTETSWRTLKKRVRIKAMKKLADRARRQLDANVVVVFEPGPILIASSRNGVIQIHK